MVAWFLTVRVGVYIHVRQGGYNDTHVGGLELDTSVWIYV